MDENELFKEWYDGAASSSAPSLVAYRGLWDTFRAPLLEELAQLRVVPCPFIRSTGQSHHCALALQDGKDLAELQRKMEYIKEDFLDYCEPIWKAVQELAPWGESNDMPWAEEILCGLHGVKERIARLEQEISDRDEAGKL